MKQMVVVMLVVLATIGTACTDDGTRQAADSDAGPQEQTTQASDSSTPPLADSSSRKADIYAAVLRQLGSDKDLARRAEVVYILDGATAGAGDPQGDPFGPASQGFSADVIARITQQVAAELPPLRFVHDGTAALRDPDRQGLVKNGGVLISLGPIDPAKGGVEVANTLWCGGKCSQWQTYVVSQRNDRWQVTGNIGPVISS